MKHTSIAGHRHRNSRDDVFRWNGWVTFEDVGPLFAGAKCNRRGEWEVDGQPHCGRLCLAHMLERWGKE